RQRQQPLAFTRLLVRDPEAELAAGLFRAALRLRAFDLAPCAFLLRDPGAWRGLELGRLGGAAAAFDQREVDAAAQHRDVVDLDGHAIAELERLAGPAAGQAHV